MTPYTPGPWDYEWSNDVGPDDDYYIEFFEVFTADKTKIAQVETAEDACLIAAAPDLFEALSYVIRDLELRSNLKLGEEKGEVDIGHGAYMQAKSALAKATGVIDG
jgi:hypothetical protein